MEDDEIVHEVELTDELASNYYEKFSLRRIIEKAADSSTGVLLSYGNAVGDAVETVGESVGNVVGGTVQGVGGAVKQVYKIAPDFDVLPDATKIDRLVDTWTYVGYGVGVASAMGVLYYTLRTSRELAQWRTFLRRRHKT